MESLESLNQRKNELEQELKSITKKKYGDVPWEPGVLDKHNSESYSYNEYTDVNRANRLINQIKYLKEQIDTYAQRARTARIAEEEEKEREFKKYKYEVAGKKEKTGNPALAARYDAQKRFFGMSKLEQTWMKINGQNKKFKKLWDKALSVNPNVQEQVAEDLGKMFR